MKNLYSLLHSLTRSEIRLLRISLISFAKRRQEETNTLKLLDFLLKKKEVPTIEEACKFIYGGESDLRFKMLKSRLKSKILDSLMHSINTEKKSFQTDHVQYAMVKIKKKVALHVQLSSSKGNHPYVKQLLNEIVFLCKEWEYYTPLAEALQYIKLRKGFRQGEKEFDELSQEIDFYENCDRAVRRANDLYYRLMMKSNFAGTPDIESIQRFINEALEQLKKDYEATQSANIAYFMMFLELAHSLNEKNYSKAKETCLRLIQLISSNKSIFRNQRIGTAYLNLGECEMHLRDYHMTIQNIQLAQEYFPKQSLNYFIAKEDELLAYFYANSIKKAAAISDELLKKVPYEAGAFRLAQYEFFKANILFIKDDYKEALKILNKKHEISKDKIGWDIAIRILTIMTLIELARYDEASLQIEGLRKHFERQSKMSEIRERDSLILKTLVYIDKQGFTFNKLGLQNSKRLELLKSVNKKYCWEPLTPELIPFHSWAEKKYAEKN